MNFLLPQFYCFMNIMNPRRRALDKCFTVDDNSSSKRIFFWHFNLFNMNIIKLT